MQKRLLITLLTLMLIIILTLTLHISFVNASPVTSNMDTLPENEGWIINKQGNATSSVSNGILTIDNNDGTLTYSSTVDWSNTVNSTEGWFVEFRVKLESPRLSDVTVTIYDNLVSSARSYHSIHLSKSALYYASRPFSQNLLYSMDTTDNFHVYRLVGQGSIVRVFVDEKLVFQGTYSTGFINPVTIEFDSGGYSNSKSYWDYFSYDTKANVTLALPTLTVIDGTSSYYISNLADVTVNNSLIPIPNGTYAGWCIDKSVTMIRNEAHNVILYSTINSTLPNDIGRYNRGVVNYVLNHKQGTMQQIQEAIWYFTADPSSPSLNETSTWNMINAAIANPNYVPGKGDIMAIIAYSGHPSGSHASSSTGIQNTILEYRIP